MDCLIKYRNMIANPIYGLLGFVTMSYQLMFELLGPIFWVIYTFLLVDKNMIPFFSVVFAGYTLVQIGLTIFAAYIDTEKNIGSLLRWMPKLILTTIEEIVLEISIMVATNQPNTYKTTPPPKRMEIRGVRKIEKRNRGMKI